MHSLAAAYDLNPRAWFDWSSIELILLYDFEWELIFAGVYFRTVDIGVNEQCQKLKIVG